MEHSIKDLGGAEKERFMDLQHIGQSQSLHVHTAATANKKYQDIGELERSKEAVGGPADKTASKSRTSSPYQLSTSPPGANGASGNASGRLNVGAHSNFVYKLLDILNNEGEKGLISWKAEGTSFIVTNVQQFSQELLPQYFKHTNYNSFVRQLNMYGFHKVTSSVAKDTKAKGAEMQQAEFAHPHFQRDKPDLIRSIKRRPAGGDSASTSSGSTGTASASAGCVIKPEQKLVQTAQYQQTHWPQQNQYYGTVMHSSHLDSQYIRTIPVAQQSNVYSVPVDYSGNMLPPLHRQPIYSGYPATDANSKSDGQDRPVYQPSVLQQAQRFHGVYEQRVPADVLPPATDIIASGQAQSVASPTFDSQRQKVYVSAQDATGAKASYSNYPYGTSSVNYSHNYAGHNSSVVQPLHASQYSSTPVAGHGHPVPHSYNTALSVQSYPVAYDESFQVLKQQVDGLAHSVKKLSDIINGQEHMLSQAAYVVTSLLDIIRDHFTPSIELSPSLSSTVDVLKNKFFISSQRDSSFHHQPAPAINVALPHSIAAVEKPTT